MNIIRKTTQILLPKIVILLFSIPVFAQIVPDRTLGREFSRIDKGTINGVRSDVIFGGAIRRSNLFHSFRKFNVNLNEGAYFHNPTGINNIIVRITGSTISNIQGILGVLGNANLFFMNPNGIIFGKNASLDLNGSFLATTADSIELGKKVSFNARNPKPVPLLAIDKPTDLTFTGNNGRISFEGIGHNLFYANNPFTPLVPIGPLPIGLQVKPGNTLALVGSGVSLSNGIIRAPSSRVEIGSVGSGQVQIKPNSSGFSLHYGGVNQFQALSISGASLIENSGISNSGIFLNAHNINLLDNSLIYSANHGSNTGGIISINADNRFLTARITPNNPNPGSGEEELFQASGVVSETFSGTGAAININADKIVIQDSGLLKSQTFGDGRGGNIEVNANVIKLQRFSTLNDPTNVSLIVTATAETGQAGDLLINTNHLSIEDGSQISSIVFGDGQGGDITVNASRSIRVTGYIPFFLSPSLLSSITLGRGDAGNLNIHTSRLMVDNGGRVDSSTLAEGDAGSVTIHASDSITVSGTIPGSLNPSSIISSANLVDPIIQEQLGLPPVPTGDAGSVALTTPHLTVSEGAQITVKHDGQGNAGTLNLSANTVRLDQGNLSASTNGGQGGNVSLDVEQLLLLKNQSSINASARGEGGGGNITINTPLLVTNSSSISANAEQSTGGQILISTTGFFARNSTLTATSQLGPQFNGIVEIDTANQDLTRATSAPTPAPASPQVSTACLNPEGSSFVHAGAGGLPLGQQNPVDTSSDWQDTSTRPTIPTITAPQPEPLVEAQGWIRNPDGTASLVAFNPLLPTPRIQPKCLPPR